MKKAKDRFVSRNVRIKTASRMIASQLLISLMISALCIHMLSKNGMGATRAVIIFKIATAVFFALFLIKRKGKYHDFLRNINLSYQRLIYGCALLELALFILLFYIFIVP